jgi:hypothetical protein
MGDASATGQIIVTALSGVGGVIVGSLISWVVQASLLQRRIAADRKLAEQKQRGELQLAERRFEYERDLHDHKRRVELAEQVLADFYQFADIMREIRTPGGFPHESADRGRTENETPEEAAKLDAYYIPIARIAKESDFFSGLKSKRYRSRALLGQPIDEAFAGLDDAVWEVQSKAIVLSGMVKRGGAAFELQPELVEGYLTTIWQRKLGDDPIEPILKHAIETGEKVCRPILGQK